MKKSIVWLASYPKSGNTWSRIFLANYLMNRDEPLPINEVRRFGTGDAVSHYYQRVAGRKIDPADWNTVIGLRYRVLKAIVANNADVNLVKTHSISSEVNGITMIPPEVTRAAVYIIRNPLDMVLSYARHYGVTASDAATAIGRSDNAVIGDRDSVTQLLGSWSEHVTSWTSVPPVPTLVLRYEDMLANPAESFGKLLDHLGIPIDQHRLEKAIRFSSFDEVSRQEGESGFGEKSSHSDRFFGKGQSGYWRNELAPELVKQIKRDHKHVMKKFGYWNV
jgi:hypothetical protein